MASTLQKKMIINKATKKANTTPLKQGQTKAQQLASNAVKRNIAMKKTGVKPKASDTILTLKDYVVAKPAVREATKTTTTRTVVPKGKQTIVRTVDKPLYTAPVNTYTAPMNTSGFVSNPVMSYAPMNTSGFVSNPVMPNPIQEQYNRQIQYTTGGSISNPLTPIGAPYGTRPRTGLYIPPEEMAIIAQHNANKRQTNINSLVESYPSYGARRDYYGQADARKKLDKLGFTIK